MKTIETVRYAIFLVVSYTTFHCSGMKVMFCPYQNIVAVLGDRLSNDSSFGQHLSFFIFFKKRPKTYFFLYAEESIFLTLTERNLYDEWQD